MSYTNEIRKDIKNYLKQKCENVYYLKASDISRFPYIVFSIRSVGDGKVLELDIWDRHKDTTRIENLTDDMIRYANVIICGTNKTREYYNNYIRRNILGYKTRLPQYGERVICRKNNWSNTVAGISIANGLVGTVITPPDISTFDISDHWINFNIKPKDGKVTPKFCEDVIDFILDNTTDGNHKILKILEKK